MRKAYLVAPILILVLVLLAGCMRVQSVVVTPLSSIVATGGTVAFAATDEQGNPVLVTWAVAAGPGTISAAGPAAREIVDAARNGFPWQASVGVEVLDRRRVAAGETVVVNGRSIKAEGNGFMLVSKGRLREVSIVSLGSDGNTAVAIAASKRQEKNMDVQVQDKQVEAQDGLDIEAAEAKRVAVVAAICEKHPEIKAKAISEGWDENKAELEVLRASRPKVPSAHLSERPGGVVTLEAAVLGHMGMLSLGEKALGAAAMEQAAMLGATSMLDLCRAALVADGVDVPRGRMEMVKAALSTYSLPTALSNVANKLLLDAYNEVPASWRSFCAIRSTADFKLNTAIRPSFSTPLEQIAPGGEFKHGTVGEWSMQYRVDTFGRMLEIDRRDLVNDDLSVFADTAAALGRAAMRRLSDLVYEVLLANAGGFFSAGNGNFFDGADSALSFDGLAKAILLLRSQRDDEDNDLDLKPATLLVTPELETTARALLNSEFIQRAENVPTGNSLRQAVNLEVEPRLANTAKFGSAASTKHWYLFAAPSFAPMIVAFLNGQQTPTTEYFGLDATPERLAAAWRVYHDFGTALCDPRAAVRSKGQA